MMVLMTFMFVMMAVRLMGLVVVMMIVMVPMGAAFVVMMFM